MEGSEVARLLSKRFSGFDLLKMLAISHRESHWDNLAFNNNIRTKDLSYGLFQENMKEPLGASRRQALHIRTNEELYNPEVAVRGAILLFDMGLEVFDDGFWHWMSYSSIKKVIPHDSLIAAFKAINEAGIAMYMVGYSGKRVSEAELLSYPQWLKVDPEFSRRFKALMDVSVQLGHAVGVGGTWRSTTQQIALFLSRTHLDPHGILLYDGQRYSYNPGAAPAAIPGNSYHESTTKEGKCLASDAIGDMVWLTQHCAEFGIYNFSNELWHVQPFNIPHSRRAYSSSKWEPLPHFKTPDEVGVPAPLPAPTVPTPTLKLGSKGSQVVLLQNVCKFFNWGNLAGDGEFGLRTQQAVRNMQSALKIGVDGIYGPKTAAAYKAFLEAHSK